MGHQLARRVGVLHVGEDHDHRPPAHAQGKVRQRVPEVGLDVVAGSLSPALVERYLELKERALL